WSDAICDTLCTAARDEDATHGRQVDSTARAWRAAGQHRALRRANRVVGVVDACLSAERRIDLRVRERGKPLLEHHQPGGLRLRRRLDGRLDRLLRWGLARLLRCRLLHGFRW